MRDCMGNEMTTQPIKRFGEPEAVTSLMMFMAAEATYSTGSEWVVDGGAVLGPVMDLAQD